MNLHPRNIARAIATVIAVLAMAGMAHGTADAANTGLTYTKGGTIHSSVAWSGSECISFQYPSRADGYTWLTGSSCAPDKVFSMTFEGTPGFRVGIDPILTQPGQFVGCATVDKQSGHTLVDDGGSTGDNRDVHCVTNLT
jgi:hypothetical protein